MGIRAHSKTRSPPVLCNPTLMNITADAADEDGNIYEASVGCFFASPAGPEEAGWIEACVDTYVLFPVRSG